MAASNQRQPEPRSDSAAESDSPRNSDAAELGLEQFEAGPDDHGLSLDELSSAYAELMGKGETPFSETAESNAEADAEHEEDLDELLEPPEDCELTPLTILEAILFVGHPENEPLTAVEISELMRGVRADEIDGLVCELNESYEEQACPYEVTAEGAGYRLVLRAEFAPLREKFYGRVREARLSQSAIDVLAIVAYNEGATRDVVEKIRGKPSAGILSQMVRRQLLRIERPDEKPRRPQYYTTPRFLQLFQLDRIEDLPRSPDFDID